MNSKLIRAYKPSNHRFQRTLASFPKNGQQKSKTEGVIFKQRAALNISDIHTYF